MAIGEIINHLQQVYEKTYDNEIKINKQNHTSKDDDSCQNIKLLSF